jgi:hypothetical protein
MNYFDRQFLRASDFQAEQAYHLDRRRGHNLGFHSPGVVEGLLVSPGSQPNTLRLGPGWAVDAQGREIVLPAPRDDLPSGALDHDVWIAYPDPEPLSTPVVEAGTSGSARVLEEPVVLVVPAGTVPADALWLARVAGGSIDNGVRALAGLQDGAVVAPNLANDAVGSRALAEAEAGTGQDANSGTGVKTSHLKDRAVTEPKLADNAASNRALAAGAVTEPKLANGAVSAAKLRSDASSDLNRAVGPNHLQSKAVFSRAIAPADGGTDQDVTTGSGVKTDHLKDTAVTTTKLADDAVTAAKLQADPADSARRAVGPNHIQAGSVSIAHLETRLVFDAQVSIGAAVLPGQPALQTLVFDLFDGPSFYLVSVHYLGPRPPAPNFAYNWRRRSPGIGQGLLFENFFPHPITLACRVHRLAEG